MTLIVDLVCDRHEEAVHERLELTEHRVIPSQSRTDETLASVLFLILRMGQQC